MPVRHHHVGDRNVRSSRQKSEGRRRQRIVRPNRLKDNPDLDRERNRLEQELAEDRQGKRPRRMRQNHQSQRQQTPRDPIGQVKKSKRHPSGDQRKDKTADDRRNELACPARKADLPGRRMKISTQPSQQVGQRKRTARREEQQQHHDHFTPPQQAQHFAIELPEALRRQTAVRPRRGHREEDPRRKQKHHPHRRCGQRHGKNTGEFATQNRRDSHAANQCDVHPLAQRISVLCLHNVRQPSPQSGARQTGRGICQRQRNLQHHQPMQAEECNSE